MPDSSHASAHLPSHTASLPATPQTEGEGRSESGFGIFYGQHALHYWLGDRWWPLDPNPFPPLSLFRRSNR